MNVQTMIVAQPAKAARTIAEKVRQQATPLSEELGALFGRDGAAARWVEVLGDVTERLDRTAARAEGAEHTRCELAREDESHRQHCDERCQHLRELVRELALVIEAVLGREALAYYMLDGDLPRAPEEMSYVVQRLIARLEHEPAVSSGSFGASFDSGRAASVLRPPLDALQAALEDIAIEQSGYEEALRQRNEALNELENTLHHGTTLLIALCQMTRRYELAKTLRRLRQEGRASTTSSTS